MIIALIRTILTYAMILVATPIIAGSVIIAGMLGLKDRPGSVFDMAPRVWSRLLLWAAGAKVVVHGGEHRFGDRHIFVGNHVSWFDVFAMAAHLRWFKFVAKAELFRIPLFGPAMRYAGMIPIERQNQSRARASIHQAGAAIEGGASVILFPEGTRGPAYTLRQFKKGAFVLAIESQAPIVPVAIHGTIEVQPKGSVLIRPGRIDLHFLPPMDTKGRFYEDRDTLAAEAKRRIGECLMQEYGISALPERAGIPANA
jgi:1-acyl-sn-glycerol-3-phosphate acyltransferase